MLQTTLGRILMSVGICWWIASTAAASQPAVEGYADFQQFEAEVRSIGRSEYAELTSLGTTLGDRAVYLLSIGTGEKDKKPAILVVGGVHPPHLLGSELAVRMARQLAEQAGSDEKIRRMLDRLTVYILPRPAPDAMEACFEQPYHARIRNARPVDDDRDARTDEDGPDDIDGDGWITTIRVTDADGPYLIHPDDDRVMIKADPKQNERGRYSVYVEGIDNDGDGELNEDPSGGVAFNRNFPFDYPYFGDAAGPHQVSEIETRAVADFAFAHSNVAIVLTFAPQDNLMHLWKVDSAAESQAIKTTLLTDDAPSYKQIADEYRGILGRSDAPEAEDGGGSFSRWAYFHYGRWSFSTRAWWIPKVQAEPEGEDGGKKPVSSGTDRRGSEDLNALRWFEKEKIDGFAAWKPIDHPSFPGRKAELGGFKPFLQLNPPAGELDGLVDQHGRLLRTLADWMPRLKISRAEAEPQGAGVWRITAVLTNEGKLPTMPKMGHINKQPQVLQMALELPKGATLITGHARMRLDPLPAGGHTEKTWLVRVPDGGAKSLRVRAWSPSVGETERPIKLAKAGKQPT